MQIFNRPGAQQSEVMSSVTEAIRHVSVKSRDVEISAQHSLTEDLALDSLDLVAVVLRIQDRFHVEIDPDELASLRSVGDLVATLAEHLRTAA